MIRIYHSRCSRILNVQRKFSTWKEGTEVKIVEVGPRDGLQNEPVKVPTELKIDFINKLTETGLKSIEVTSFVSPKWVPQMADNTEVYTGISKKDNIDYPVLIPNLIGLESALKVGVKEIAVVASASESFSKKNMNCSAVEGLERIKKIIDLAKSNNLKVRGYVSCVVGCPYDGIIKPIAVTRSVSALLELGCYEVSLGDTIGVGTKKTIHNMIKDILNVSTPERLAIHCHDTYGQALTNICTALDLGVTVVDSSVGGLGGCPYAKGATGNAATEDVVYMIHGMGANTGVDLKKLVAVGHFISKAINRPTDSKVNAALASKYFL